MVNPYADQRTNDRQFTRTFEADVAADELVWHRDRRTRTIQIREGTGWKIQMDDQLPVELQLNEQYRIPKEQYHRLIRGTGRLVIDITEE